MVENMKSSDKLPDSTHPIIIGQAIKGKFSYVAPGVPVHVSPKETFTIDLGANFWGREATKEQTLYNPYPYKMKLVFNDKCQEFELEYMGEVAGSFSEASSYCH